MKYEVYSETTGLEGLEAISHATWLSQLLLSDRLSLWFTGWHATNRSHQPANPAKPLTGMEK